MILTYNSQTALLARTASFTVAAGPITLTANQQKISTDGTTVTYVSTGKYTVNFNPPTGPGTTNRPVHGSVALVKTSAQGAGLPLQVFTDVGLDANYNLNSITVYVATPVGVAHDQVGMTITIAVENIVPGTN